MSELGKVWSGPSELYVKPRKSEETPISEDLFHQIVQVSTASPVKCPISPQMIKSQVSSNERGLRYGIRATEAPK